VDPARRNGKRHALFEALAGARDFGADSILHSSRGLFADAEVIPLTPKSGKRGWELFRSK
jgi:hypothetical protein